MMSTGVPAPASAPRPAPRRPRRRRHAARVIVYGALLCGLWHALARWPVEAERYLDPHPSGELLDRRGRPLAAFLNADAQWCFPRPLESISPWLIEATIAVEDRRFRQHGGVDPLAVLRAAWQNATRGRVVSGASTLSMQLVKRGGDSRALAGKLAQAWQALRLERRAGKDEILAAYLNNAPYGHNLVGCEAAARRYFGKPAAELTLAEAALLAAIPKAPARLSPLRHPDRARARRDHVLERMRACGVIDDAELRVALAAPLGARRREFPLHAAHLAMRLRPALAGGGAFRSTLDAAAQLRLEQLARDFLAAQAPRVECAAAVVIETQSGHVLAHLGSPDYFAAQPGARIDATRAPRSPGSALKPFLYALAMQRQRLFAGEMLLDDRLDYGLYRPENFERLHNGLVDAGEALRRSLNVPAITVVDRLGVAPACAFLAECGLTTLRRDPVDYGLGLALGNVEVRLEELAAAYAMLARLGEFRPAVFTPSRVAPATRLLDPGIALQLYQMLEQPLPREWDPDALSTANGAPRVCWKTGTSTGRRDAWAFVFNRHYTVGVWVGHADGRPEPRLTGATMALPLAASVFRALPPLRGAS